MKKEKNWYVKPEGIFESESSGGVIVKITRGRVLVALVRQGELSGYFLPKGQVEPGEDLETAARREIREEAGFEQLDLVEYLGKRERLNSRRDRWIIAHYFLFMARGRQDQPTDRNHKYTCEWFPLDRLPEMFWPDQQEMLEELRESILLKLKR